MDQTAITGLVGAGSAILGALSQATVSSVITGGSSLRKERIRVIIDIEEYLDEMWALSNSLYDLRQNEIASFHSSDEAETKRISALYNTHLDRFYSIWDSRKRIIELDLYFKDKDSLVTYRKIERLYERTKNKIELLSPCPMTNNDKLLKDLLDFEDEIYGLRSELSKRLKLYLTWVYILLPTYMRLGHNLKEWLRKPCISLDESIDTSGTAQGSTRPGGVKHGRKQSKHNISCETGLPAVDEEASVEKSQPSVEQLKTSCPGIVLYVVISLALGAFLFFAYKPILSIDTSLRGLLLWTHGLVSAVLLGHLWTNTVLRLIRNYIYS